MSYFVQQVFCSVLLKVSDRRPENIQPMNCPICKQSAELLYDDLYDDRYGYPGVFSLYNCTSCGHKHLDCRLAPSALQDLYTNYYPRKNFDLDSYRPLEKPQPFRGWFNGERRAYSFVPENVRVLDIGCGFGESLGYHKRRNCDVYGVEADENIKRVAEKFDFKVHVGLFREGVYPNEFFDYITMDQVLEHIQDPISILQAAANILKPTGKLIITVPYANGWSRQLYGKKWLHWHVPYHLHFFSKKSICLAARFSKLNVRKHCTITSSEWLFYQKMNCSFYPDIGTPSAFFSPNYSSDGLPVEIDKKRAKIRRHHQKYRVNHIVTRFFDLVGRGDNLLVIFEKGRV